MLLEIMWQCGLHRGRELFQENLLAQTAATFCSFASRTPADRLTPAAREILRRTAARCEGGDVLVRRWALAWLAHNGTADGSEVSVTVRRVHQAEEIWQAAFSRGISRAAQAPGSLAK